MRKPHNREFLGRQSLTSEILSSIGPYRKYVIQIGVIVVTGVSLNVIIPFTNRAMIDAGVMRRDELFVWLMVGLQLALYAGIIFLHALRNIATVHISSRMTTKVLWKFFGRLLLLPMEYFDNTNSGQILERIRDFDRVQRFASTDIMDVVAAGVTFLALAPILLWFHWSLFAVFIVSALLYVAWTMAFRKYRHVMDGRRFEHQTRVRAIEVALIGSMEDIKIAGRERATLGHWEAVQVDVLGIKIRMDTVDQWQFAGGRAMSRAGQAVIMLVAAIGVVEGELTFGEMIVTALIATQLYYHIDQIIAFSAHMQEAALSISRISELRYLPTEDNWDADDFFVASNGEPSDAGPGGNTSHLVLDGAMDGPLSLENIVFRYDEAGYDTPVLAGINLEIPPGSTIALVGPSGSGKSTLMKLLLKLYSPSEGNLRLGGVALKDVSTKSWRSICGAVMQDGSLFPDSVSGNIVGQCQEDALWLNEVIELSCCSDFIAALPEGINTRIGPGGAILSAGQRQRVLIARAIYKRPKFLFLDEATSALDNENERRISENLDKALPEATRVVIAHRLGTVRGADQIAVFDRGRIREIGTHEQLMRMAGAYSDLFFAEA